MVLRSEQALAAAASAAEFAKNGRIVAQGFWRKLAKFARQLPFAEELAAAWFCATDPATPASAKAILIAALAYFVLPLDAIPDFIAGIGFTDDAAVLALAIRTVSRHMKPEHYARGRAALGHGGPVLEARPGQ
jgi:uncharacterized membrane protein YkvA (DUF1232 family)